MYTNYTSEELRSICRNSIEAFEMWGRRIIHEKMTEKYGSSYCDAKSETGEYIIKSEIRKRLQKDTMSGQADVGRSVDRMLLDDIVYFLCHVRLYKELFKPILDKVFPMGVDTARAFLKRLVPIRNALSHSRPISRRQAEQAVCYSNDFIDGLKEYYKEQGMERVWNVPRVIRLNDSFGNEFDVTNDNRYGGSNITVNQPLYPGELYTIQIEVDSSFEESEYTITWKKAHKSMDEMKNQKRVSIPITIDDVGIMLLVTVHIISNRSWHKYRTYDHAIAIALCVYPPRDEY